MKTIVKTHLRRTKRKVAVVHRYPRFKKPKIFYVKDMRYVNGHEVHPKGLAYPDLNTMLLSDKIPKGYKQVVKDHEMGHLLDKSFRHNNVFDVLLSELKAETHAFKKNPIKTTKYIFKQSTTPEGLKTFYNLYLNPAKKKQRLQIKFRSKSDSRKFRNIFTQ